MCGRLSRDRRCENNPSITSKKGDLKSKKGKQTIHFQSTTQTKGLIFLIVLACTLRYVIGLIGNIVIKKLIFVKVKKF